MKLDIIQPVSSDVPLPDVPHGNPARRHLADANDFREAMATMAASVGVVATQFGGERRGRTVTAAMSLSLDPPTILVSIDATSHLADLMTKAAGFSFSILADAQDAIANAFAGQIEAERRFDYGTWAQWSSGHPKLLNAVSILDCEIIGAVSTATHVLFVGAARAVEVDSDRIPLIRHARRYRRLADYDDATEEGK